MSKQPTTGPDDLSPLFLKARPGSTISDIFTDPALNTFRLRTAMGALEGLIDYGRLFSRAESHLRSQPKEASLISQMVAERAHEAAYFSQVLAEIGIASMNDLRDSGGLDTLISRVGRRLSKGLLKEDFDNAFAELTPEFKKLFPYTGIEPLAVLGRTTSRILSRNAITLVSGSKGSEVRYKKVDGKQVRTPLFPIWKKGIGIGRVAADTAFSGQIKASPSIIFNSEAFACRSENLMPNARNQLNVDFYSQFVGASLTLREAILNHAAQVSEFGLSEISGRKKWWEWLILGLACVIVVVIIALVFGSGSGRGSIQLCASNNDPLNPGGTSCMDLTPTQTAESWSGILFGTAAAVLGAVSGEAGGLTIVTSPPIIVQV